MLSQGTALASEALRIGATLRNDYGIDPAPLYDACGIDADEPGRPGERLAHAVIDHSWSASGTLRGAIERMIRYERVVTSPFPTTSFERVGDACRLRKSAA